MKNQIFPRELPPEPTPSEPVAYISSSGIWLARVLGVLLALGTGGIFGVILMTQIFNSPDYTSSFLIGAIVPLFFSIPFLFK